MRPPELILKKNNSTCKIFQLEQHFSDSVIVDLFLSVRSILELKAYRILSINGVVTAHRFNHFPGCGKAVADKVFSQQTLPLSTLSHWAHVPIPQESKGRSLPIIYGHPRIFIWKNLPWDSVASGCVNVELLGQTSGVGLCRR